MWQPSLNVKGSCYRFRSGPCGTSAREEEVEDDEDDDYE
jgi:hypothetical protein